MNQEPRTKKPEFGLVLVFSLLSPGLSFYYAGKDFGTSLRIAIGVAILDTGILALPDRVFGWKLALVVAILSAVALTITVTVLALRTATRYDPPRGTKRRYLPLIGALVVLGVAFGVFDEFGDVRARKNYKVPTASMEPTIQVGDRVRGRLDAYENGRLPENGDLVVFKYPKDPEIVYVKRVVARAGEKIRVVNQRIIVNGDDRTSVQAPPGKSGSFGGRPFPAEGGDFVVPEGTVFVVGDNLSNSTDSRIWGAVPLDHLVAKVEGVVFSYDGDAGMRWDRTGLDLH